MGKIEEKDRKRELFPLFSKIFGGGDSVRGGGRETPRPPPNNRGHPSFILPIKRIASQVSICYLNYIGRDFIVEYDLKLLKRLLSGVTIENVIKNRP